MPYIDTQTVPSRHPASPGKAPASFRLLAKVLRIEKPSAAQWQEIGAALTIGDDPMEALVDWMYAAGISPARRLVNQAIDRGIDSIADAPEPLRAFFTDLESPPAWVDWDLIALGQRVFRRVGADGVYMGRDGAFLAGYVASGINQTLLRTKSGKSGDTGGATRFAETLQWALDVIEGVRPGEVGYRSTLQVRLIHTFVRRGIRSLEEWQPEEWGLPVNQTDMAATILGALFAPVVSTIAMGHLITLQELNAVAHLTRYVGWLMGVQDRFLPSDSRDAIRKLYWYLAALNAPDESTAILAAPMANDPLTWHYPNFAWLRRRLARAQHLSITSLIMGPKGMRQLGLPAYVPPWYPAMRFPINLALSMAALLLPGGRDRQAMRGRRAQDAFMRVLVGPKATVEVGGTAAYVYEVA